MGKWIKQIECHFSFWKWDMCFRYARVCVEWWTCSICVTDTFLLPSGDLWITENSKFQMKNVQIIILSVCPLSIIVSVVVCHISFWFQIQNCFIKHFIVTKMFIFFLFRLFQIWVHVWLHTEQKSNGKTWFYHQSLANHSIVAIEKKTEKNFHEFWWIELTEMNRSTNGKINRKKRL